MEYIFRVLNDYDLIINPQKNGLINKALISSNLRFLFDLMVNTTPNIFNHYSQLTEKQRIKVYNEIYDDVKYSFLEETLYNTINEVQWKDNKIQELLTDIRNKEGGINQSNFSKLLDIFSTVQTHLVCGSRFDTPWISSSKSILALKKYYLKQKKHAIAVVKSELDNTYNFANNRIEIVLDLSTREKINSNDLLINKKNPYGSYNYTDKNCKQPRT